MRDEELENRLGRRERRTGLTEESNRGAKLKETVLARGI